MEDDFSVEKPRIGKLTGPNYRPWSVQLQRLLLGQGLWNVIKLGIESTETQAVTGAEGTVGGAAGGSTGSSTEEKMRDSAPSGDRTEVKDAKASTIIMGLCARDVLQHILLLNTAKEQWEALKALYAPLGLQQLGAKTQAFTGYRPPESGATVAVVATELSTLQYEIGAIDPAEKPSDTLKISLLFQAIRALDERFGPLILQLEISGITTNFSVIVARLTDFERRMGPKEALKESVLSAKTGAKKAFQGKCFNCGKPGHKKANCRSRKSAESPSTGPLETPGGGRGLSPGPKINANSAVEASWIATTGDSYSGDDLLWIVDSGCSRHMTFCKEAFTEYSALNTPIRVNTASGACITAIAEGTIQLSVAVNGAKRTVALTKVLHVPKLTGSLISVLQLQDKGITVRTTVGPEGNKLLIELQGSIVGVASRFGRAYALDSTLQGLGARHSSLKATIGDPATAQLWHRRFGHLSPGSLQHVHAVTTGLAKAITALQEPCKACILTKTVRVVNRKSPERATAPLQRVHSDFWGPYSVPTLQGNTYMLTFTDDYTRKSWVYLTKSRNQLRTVFLQFKALVELESGHKIKAVRCDNASEYKSLGALLQKDYGVQFEYTTTYTPEQNGVSERLNRSLISVARAMLLDAKLPIRFWGEAVTTACYLRNRTPIGPEGKTPEEAYSGRKPNIGHLRAYGCVAYAHIPKERRQKLKPTAVKACLIGYMPTSRQYRLYEPEKGEVIISTAPIFTENKHLEWDWKEELIGEETVPFDPMEAVREPEAPVTTGHPETEIQNQDPEEEPEQQPSQALQSPIREPEQQPSQALQSPIRETEQHLSQASQELEGDTIVVDTGEPEGTEAGDFEAPVQGRGPVATEPQARRSQRLQHQAHSAVEGPPIPRTYAEAINDPRYKAHWEQAISEELTKLQALDTWEYAELPPGKKAVGCKWVFTVKYTPTGLIDRYKARLVAQGFSQVPGDDYLETFSPTIRAESLRILLAIGAFEDLEMRQIDVISAYPRSKLHAVVYMRPPEALKCPKNRVLLLKNSLYGLKQSGREWYIEASSGLKSLGFTSCFSEPSVFVTADRSVIIGLYVDDMLILGHKLQAVQRTIQGISALWEIKDLGDVALILGIRVRRERRNRTLSIDQSQYIQGLIGRFRLEHSTPVTLPVNDRNTLITGLPGEPQANQALYQQAIGCLIWLAKGSRPDIAYAVGQLSQHCNEPTIRHWNAVLRVLRYLKGTENYKAKYGDVDPSSYKLQGYSDADYAGDIVDRHSITGHMFLLNRGPVTWASVKQRCIATSTTESEYIALSEASKQGQWIRALLRELQRTQYLDDTLATPLFSDNQGCIALARDPVAHSRTKHIDVRYHYIRELVSYGKATIEYIRTADMLADVLTKPLPLTAFKHCIQGLLSL